MIAAVNGVAMGGGFEIALACDIIVAAENAMFALPEPRVGLAALAGGVHRLPRSIGAKQAMGMILTGRRVAGPGGRRAGLRQRGRARRRVGGGRPALGRDDPRVLADVGAGLQAGRLPGPRHADVQEAMRNGQYPAVADMSAARTSSEGPKAFAEKRSPQWKGR